MDKLTDSMASYIERLERLLNHSWSGYVNVINGDALALVNGGKRYDLGPIAHATLYPSIEAANADATSWNAAVDSWVAQLHGDSSIGDDFKVTPTPIRSAIENDLTIQRERLATRLALLAAN